VVTAGDWEGWVAGVRLMTTLNLNVVYADVSGGIGYQCSGEAPLRPCGDDGMLPMDGTTVDSDWKACPPHSYATACVPNSSPTVF
jgi:acyl-homoserine lactone acylase PvdQ